MNGLASPNLGVGDITEEAGASENRLTVNPTDDRWKESVGNWEDGKVYEGKFKMRQISPGNFEILALSGMTESEAGETKVENEITEQETEAPARSYGNSSAPNIMV